MLLNLAEVLTSQQANKKKLTIRKFKPIKSSIRTQMWYQQQLLGFVKSVRSELETALKPDKPTLFDTAVNDKGIPAFNIDRFLSTLKRYQGMDIDSFASRTAREFTARGNEQNSREVAENVKRQTGVDLQGFLQGNAKINERLEQLTTANVALIQSIHTQYLDKVQNAVLQAQIKGELNADLAQKIREIGGVTENRAKLIARDQSAKVNAALTRARHEELGVTHYRWSTSGDERVRDSHAELDGKIFAYDNPPEVGNPGDSVNCRCVALPLFDKDEIKQAQQAQSEQTQEKSLEIEKTLPKDLPDVINVGKSVHQKYKDILDDAIANGKPHEGVMEIMRREGVELGGVVNVVAVSAKENVSALEFMNSIKRYPKSWVERSNQSGVILTKEIRDTRTKQARAYHAVAKEGYKLPVDFSRYGRKGLIKDGDTLITINMSKPTVMARISTNIHEFGHKLQRNIPELDQYFVNFWRERTKEFPIERLKDVTNLNYKPSEITIKDHFPNPYYGKIYRDRGKEVPKEMLTMTFESMLGGNKERFLELYKKDPELFNLGLALLVRFK